MRSSPELVNITTTASWFISSMALRSSGMLHKESVHTTVSKEALQAASRAEDHPPVRAHQKHREEDQRKREFHVRRSTCQGHEEAPEKCERAYERTRRG